MSSSENIVQILHKIIVIIFIWLDTFVCRFCAMRQVIMEHFWGHEAYLDVDEVYFDDDDDNQDRKEVN